MVRRLHMKGTLLISQLDSLENSNKKRRVFFNIGDIKSAEVSNRLINLLHDCDIVDINDIVLKYNGIELNITIQQIPSVLKMLCKKNFCIYEVYQPYNPEE